MTSIQKIIKYAAIAFALFIIISIVVGIVESIGWLMPADDDITYGTSSFEPKGEPRDLEIDIYAADLTIKTGETFWVETNNDYINCKQNGDTLVIKEKKHNWFRKNNKSKLTIYLPEGYTFDETAIDCGAGKVNIEELRTEELDMDLGAGEVLIEALYVEREADVDGGAGKIAISSGEITDLDLDLGVGEFVCEAFIYGDSDIDCGVGSVSLVLKGNRDDYRIRLEKGIGNAYLEGEGMTGNQVYGDGYNRIDIEGGVGNIDIRFE